MSENSPERFLRPDSPWLWVGLFASVGLSGVLIISPKYADRRERLDRQFQGRQKVMEDTSAKALQAANISPEETSENESQNSLLWFVGAIAIGSSFLAGFAFYVFRGGHLRQTITRRTVALHSCPTHSFNTLPLGFGRFFQEVIPKSHVARRIGNVGRSG